MEETGNINDQWICIKCGRFANYRFYEHATRNGKMDFCTGKVYRFKTWLKKMKEKMI